MFVEYRGRVSLRPFKCAAVSSSLVDRVCYDARQAYILVALNGTGHHYCRIPPDAVQALVSAPSVGKHCNADIRGRFDCRSGGIPDHPN